MGVYFLKKSESLKDIILRVITICSTADKDILLSAIHPSYKYASRMINELLNEGIITYKGNDKKTLRLTPKGIESLLKKSVADYDFYMQYSYNNKLPTNQNFRERTRRTTGVIACMINAGIAVGTEKPSLENLRTEQAKKMSPETATFYMAKEVRGDYGQQRSVVHKSRATGYFFTPGLNALVFNVMDKPMLLNRNEELSINRISIYLQASLYETNAKIVPPQDTLVFFKNDEAALRILNEPRPTNAKRNTNTIAEIVQNPSFLQTNIRYIPTNETGIITLKILSKYTQEDILSNCFTSDERAAAKTRGVGDAVINGLTVYEFISSNITKLTEVKNTADLTKTGIVCWEGQKDFIVDFLAPRRTYVRCLKKEEVISFIERGTSLLRV